MPRIQACDACKRRKVRCDDVFPCSNCRMSEIQCEYRIPPKKRGPRVTKRPVNRESTPCTPLDDVSPRGISSIGEPELLQSPRDIQQSPASVSNSDSIAHVARVSLLGTPSDAAQIYTNSISQIKSVLVSTSIENVVYDCIDLFLQYMFPNTPIVHEPSLRAGASLFLPDNTALSAPSNDVYRQIDNMRSFALITALCASVIAVVPDSLLQQPKSLSILFLQASRAMLRVYEAYDLEHPNSTSLMIRMWHSAVMQNTTGRVGASWHYHAEAACLAQRLRLFNERSVARDSVIESQLLRENFWLLYLAEKTQVAFESRPPIIDERLSDDGRITLLEYGDQEAPLLDTNRKVNQASLEHRLFLGFHLKRRAWAMAADLVDEIKAHARRIDGASTREAAMTDGNHDVSPLVEKYLLFTALFDQLPPWLRHPDGNADAVNDEEVAAYQRICFWAQRSNILTVFHCMKLVILQKCIDCNLPSVIGLNNSALSWALRKIEIVRDFVHELEMVPFACFKVQGEPGVDKIRRVGTILLELLHNAGNATIESRAKSLFEQLLDLLAKLDSRASDELGEQQLWQVPT